MGPANAGKSALVCALGNRIYKPARMYGEILINGLPPKRSPIQPTFFDAADEPLMNVTVELALLYTGEPQSPCFCRLQTTRAAALPLKAWYIFHILTFVLLACSTATRQISPQGGSGVRSAQDLPAARPPERPGPPHQYARP